MRVNFIEIKWTWIRWEAVYLLSVMVVWYSEFVIELDIMNRFVVCMCAHKGHKNELIFKKESKIFLLPKWIILILYVQLFDRHISIYTHTYICEGSYAHCVDRDQFVWPLNKTREYKLYIYIWTRTSLVHNVLSVLARRPYAVSTSLIKKEVSAPSKSLLFSPNFFCPCIYIVEKIVIRAIFGPCLPQCLAS